MGNDFANVKGPTDSAAQIIVSRENNNFQCSTHKQIRHPSKCTTSRTSRCVNLRQTIIKFCRGKTTTSPVYQTCRMFSYHNVHMFSSIMPLSLFWLTLPATIWGAFAPSRRTSYCNHQRGHSCSSLMLHRNWPSNPLNPWERKFKHDWLKWFLQGHFFVWTTLS